jgi:hypothetical protein
MTRECCARRLVPSSSAAELNHPTASPRPLPHLVSPQGRCRFLDPQSQVLPSASIEIRARARRASYLMRSRLGNSAERLLQQSCSFSSVGCSRIQILTCDKGKATGGDGTITQSHITTLPPSPCLPISWRSDLAAELGHVLCAGSALRTGWVRILPSQTPGGFRFRSRRRGGWGNA